MLKQLWKQSFCALSLLTLLSLSACNRTLGYGVLFWSQEYPPIPSGTVLKVYIRSNINRVWVVGIPKEFRSSEDSIDKFEVPLSHLELVGSRKKALARAEDFAAHALVYAETLQDGLPIRESPDNGSRRVYRLRGGEIVKVIRSVEGQLVIGGTGDPLPGEWLRVLTANGTFGYCFSYRLNLFEHSGGTLTIAENQAHDDPDLDSIFARTWLHESYGAMIETQRINLDALIQRWHFDPGQESGTARIRTQDIDRTFSYRQIQAMGNRSWRFDGSSLQMSLRTDTSLAVQFNDDSGILRTLTFVTLPSRLDDIIQQETIRQEALFLTIYEHGPVFSSTSSGTITFLDNGRFTWDGNALLVPQIIPASALGRGSVNMRLFQSNAMGALYAGAFTLNFDGVGGRHYPVNFMYTLDVQGFRLEYVPETSIDNLTVVRRSSSPQILYFYRSESDRAESFQALPSLNLDSLEGIDDLSIPGLFTPGARNSGQGRR